MNIEQSKVSGTQDIFSLHAELVGLQNKHGNRNVLLYLVAMELAEADCGDDASHPAWALVKAAMEVYPTTTSTYER